MIEIVKITINGYEQSYFSEGKITISWQIGSEIKNILQTDYRIQIASSKKFENILWDSQKVHSGKSQFVETDGFNPEHLCRYFVRVKIWENHGWESPWSCEKDFLYFEREKIPWKAQWVSAPEEFPYTCDGIYIRKDFDIDKKVCKAFLISSAQGVYEPYLDGERISDELFLPGWTAYEERIQYQIWDIPLRLTEKGRHILSCILAPGWFKGRLGENGRKIYGERTAWIAQIYMCYEDGTTAWVITDGTCQCHASPLLKADMYDGETYDARLELQDWSFDTNSWFPTETKDADSGKLWPQKIRGVCRHERFEGNYFRTPDGAECIDFGQNMAGVTAFKVKGNPGDKVELVCFEALDKDGGVYTDNLRSAGQTITYYCRGETEEYYISKFSYQGFRYIQIRSWPGICDASAVHAFAVYSDIPYDGKFFTSNRLVNRLIKNIRWSMKSNFVDIPTDCPQRDERLGWTGDAQIFSEAAVYLANVYGFYEKWLIDVALEQLEDGGIPHLVPDILRFEDQSGDWLLSQGTHSAAAWADVIVLVPWRLYQYYGNRSILENFYNPMKRWINFMWRHSEGYLWNYKLQFGDWLALDAPEGNYFGATPNELTCTAYFAYSTGIFQKIADILGKKKDSEIYKKLYCSIRKVFAEQFIGEDGLLLIKTQTALAMSLCFQLVPTEYVRKNADELKIQIQNSGNHMTTGFMGTPCILTALSENGLVEEAYDLLLREDYPSWLYQVKKGATTVWEHLDGVKPDGSMWSSDMNSFNHYTYGTVAAWLFKEAAGIKSIEKTPGFRKFIIQPKLSYKLPMGCASVETPYGKIEVCWKQKENQYTIMCEIPPNAQAEILLDKKNEIIKSEGLKFNQKGKYKTAIAGSGTYTILYGISEDTPNKYLK